MVIGPAPHGEVAGIVLENGVRVNISAGSLENWEPVPEPDV